MNLTSETAVTQGMVLASLIGGIALACIAQLVAAFPAADDSPRERNVSGAVLWLAVTATLMMINVWSGIIFFMDDGADRYAIARVFYGGLFLAVAFFALGMAQMIAVRTPRLYRPMLVMFGGLLLAEAILGIVFLR